MIEVVILAVLVVVQELLEELYTSELMVNVVVASECVFVVVVMAFSLAQSLVMKSQDSHQNQVNTSQNLISLAQSSCESVPEWQVQNVYVHARVDDLHVRVNVNVRDETSSSPFWTIS